jgi:hypothetical protein
MNLDEALNIVDCSNARAELDDLRAECERLRGRVAELGIEAARASNCIVSLSKETHNQRTELAELRGRAAALMETIKYVNGGLIAAAKPEILDAIIQIGLAKTPAPAVQAQPEGPACG